jgi:ATP-dependent Lon protease
MQESAAISLSHVRANSKSFGIADDFFDNSFIHIHVPEGATPKDGPSAGVTITTALVSLATGKSIQRSLAMTGEITLTGDVLPVGGIKEKLLLPGVLESMKLYCPMGAPVSLTSFPIILKKG